MPRGRGIQGAWKLAQTPLARWMLSRDLDPGKLAEQSGIARSVIQRVATGGGCHGANLARLATHTGIAPEVLSPARARKDSVPEPACAAG